MDLKVLKLNIIIMYIIIRNIGINLVIVIILFINVVVFIFLSIKKCIFYNKIDVMIIFGSVLFFLNIGKKLFIVDINRVV